MLEIVQVYGHKLHKTLVKNQTFIHRKEASHLSDQRFNSITSAGISHPSRANTRI